MEAGEYTWEIPAIQRLKKACADTASRLLPTVVFLKEESLGAYFLKIGFLRQLLRETATCRSCPRPKAPSSAHITLLGSPLRECLFVLVSLWVFQSEQKQLNRACQIQTPIQITLPRLLLYNVTVDITQKTLNGFNPLSLGLWNFKHQGVACIFLIFGFFQLSAAPNTTPIAIQVGSFVAEKTAAPIADPTTWIFKLVSCCVHILRKLLATRQWLECFG